MQAGDLNRRINIQQDTSDGTRKTPVYALLASVWANKRDLSNRQFFNGAASQAESSVMYTIRYRTDVRPGMQIVDSGRVYDIDTVPVDVRNLKQWLEIHAVEVTQNGAG